VGAENLSARLPIFTGGVWGVGTISKIVVLRRSIIDDHRLFYKISEEIVIVFVIDIETRKDAYQ